MIIGSLIGWILFSLAKQNIVIEDKLIYQIYDEIRRLINLELPDEDPVFTEVKENLNRRFIEDKELLDYRVKSDVTYALNEYRRSLEMGPQAPDQFAPKAYQLGDAIGIRAPWYVEEKKEILDPNLRKWAFSNENMIESVGTPIQKEILQKSRQSSDDK